MKSEERITNEKPLVGDFKIRKARNTRKKYVPRTKRYGKFMKIVQRLGQFHKKSILQKLPSINEKQLQTADY